MDPSYLLLVACILSIFSLLFSNFKRTISLLRSMMNEKTTFQKRLCFRSCANSMHVAVLQCSGHRVVGKPQACWTENAWFVAIASFSLISTVVTARTDVQISWTSDFYADGDDRHTNRLLLPLAHAEIGSANHVLYIEWVWGVVMGTMLWDPLALFKYTDTHSTRKHTHILHGHSKLSHLGVTQHHHDDHANPPLLSTVLQSLADRMYLPSFSLLRTLTRPRGTHAYALYCRVRATSRTRRRGALAS